MGKEKENEAAASGAWSNAGKTQISAGSTPRQYGFLCASVHLFHTATRHQWLCAPERRSAYSQLWWPRAWHLPTGELSLPLSLPQGRRATNRTQREPYLRWPSGLHHPHMATLGSWLPAHEPSGDKPHPATVSLFREGSNCSLSQMKILLPAPYQSSN